MRKLLPVFALFLFPVHIYAQWGQHGNVTIAPSADLPKNQWNIGAARDIERALELIGNKTGDWTILAADHDDFQKIAKKDNPELQKQLFPARCFTVIKKKTTVCDIAYVTEVSGMALAGSLAHEYGHILCGPKERDADQCGAELLHGVPVEKIK
jgi:hypothetical protein